MAQSILCIKPGITELRKSFDSVLDSRDLHIIFDFEAQN